MLSWKQRKAVFISQIAEQLSSEMQECLPYTPFTDVTMSQPRVDLESVSKEYQWRADSDTKRQASSTHLPSRYEM